MNRVDRLAAVFALLILFGSSGLSQDKPNIVLVMADDQGWGQAG